MMNTKTAFQTAEILKSANPASLAYLASTASLKRVKKGAHLFMDKETVTTVYTVISGRVSLYKLNSIGEKKVIFVYGKGCTLNEVILQDLPASINCEVLEDAAVLCIPKNDLLHVMEQDFALTKTIIDSMSTKIRRLYRQLKNTSHSIRIDKKIAAKLWKLSLDHGVPTDEGIRIAPELSITYFADMLGTKRETVSRHLKILTEEGLIIYRKNHFIIPDRDALMHYFKFSE